MHMLLAIISISEDDDVIEMRPFARERQFWVEAQEEEEDFGGWEEYEKKQEEDDERQNQAVEKKKLLVSSHAGVEQDGTEGPELIENKEQKRRKEKLQTETKTEENGIFELEANEAVMESRDMVSGNTALEKKI